MFKFLAILCLLLAAGLFFFDADKISSEIKDTKELEADSTKNINYRLKSADQKKQIKEIQMQNNFDNEILQGTIEEDLRSHNLKVPKGLDDRIDTTLLDVYNDLNLGQKEEVKQKLEDEVQRSLAEMQESKELSEYEKQLFIKSFVENAKRRGIKIYIDENLNVFTK